MTLTPRQVEIIALASKGLQDKEIAQMLGIGYETVKKHMGTILIKLRVSNRTEAAVLAVRSGII